MKANWLLLAIIAIRLLGLASLQAGSAAPPCLSQAAGGHGDSVQPQRLV